MNNLKNKLDTSGIYGILCKITNKWYIGQAENFYARWGDHKRSLRRKKNGCVKLQNAWNKYGESNFEFYILCDCTTNYLDCYEKFFINSFDSIKNGYNCNDGGGGSVKRSGAIKRIDTGEIVYFNSLTEIARKYNLTRTTVVWLIEGKIDMYKGWCRIDYELPSFTFKKNNTQITVKDLSTFCKTHGLQLGHLKRLINNPKSRTCEGWSLIRNKALDDYKYKFISSQNEIVVGDYLSDIGKTYNLNPSYLSDLWTGQTKCHQGWRALHETLNKLT